MSIRGKDIARCLLVAGLGAGAIVGVLWLFVWLASTAAKAQDGDSRDERWVYRTIRQQYVSCNEWTGECYRAWRYVRVRNYAYHLPEASPTRVYGYTRRDDDRDLCRDIRRAVGDQHLTIDGAKKAANDAWAGAVRFHLGERWMSLDNARRITYTCSRSSIKEGGTSVTTLGQQLQRCEIEAQPCAAPREREERDR